MATEDLYQYTGCGLDNVRLRNGYTIKDTPYGKGVAIDNLDGLHKAIAMAVVDKKAPLSGDEVRFLRIEMDLPQRALGEFLGKKDQTVALWEKGKQEVPEGVDYLIRHIYRQRIDERAVYVDEVNRLRALDIQDYRSGYQFQEDGAQWSQGCDHHK